MSITGAKIASVAFPSSSIEKLDRQTATSLESEKNRLKKATKEFESFFMYQILKTMRKTVPESTFNEGAPFSGDMSKDIFTEMFDMQLAQKMVTGDERSISEILYESLVKLIEAQFSDEEAPVKLKPLGAEKNDGIEIDRPGLEMRSGENESREVKPKPDQFLPVSVRPSQPKNDAILSQFGRYIDKAAELTSLDPALIISVIRVESGGDPKAISPAGAKGLMQLIDSTATDYGVTQVFDPEENIRAGSRFLKDQLDRFGSLKLALAAYNAGPENVKRYGGIPPFEETEKYVEKVIDTLTTINRPARNATAKAVRGTVDK